MVYGTGSWPVPGAAAGLDGCHARAPGAPPTYIPWAVSLARLSAVGCPHPPLMYGIYLIPPTSVAIQLSLAHTVLEREFGAAAAGRFMVHVTVQGFFRLNLERIRCS
jgi:hypothetical protein